MSLDYNKINEYLQEVRQIEETLLEHQELFDHEKLIEFKQTTAALEKNIELAQNASRKLSIGIVGAMKAGKSSFLNACIFGGEDYLPKAATPMTAALTKITYSEEPKAIIHFYTKEDWKTIESQASMYDEALQKAYRNYCDQINTMNAQAGYGYTQYTPLMSKENFERGYKHKSENQRGAKELTRMVTNPTLLDKLGTSDEVEGDIIQKLNDYVGAGGYYTPIVSYVELQINNPYVKDLEIVDTPGLNDPIVSRGIKTKQFLRSCDVVLLLSPCSQFMDANTVNLMANSLPNAGVNEILVIGSKLDSGILNESISDFLSSYKKSLISYNRQFSQNLEAAKKTGKHLDILNKMSVEKLLFISATCFSIERKKRNNIPLDSQEQKVYNNLHSVYSNFDDKYLSSLGGINKVKIALNEVLKRKISIIESKNSQLLDNARFNHLSVLEKILQETVSSRSKLETTSAEELKQRTSNIRDIIDSSRSKLLHIFNLATIKCDEKVQQILPQLTMEKTQHQRIVTQKSSHEKHDTINTGFLGMKKERITTLVTDTSADTSDVINNITQYSASCLEYVNREFKNIFNKEEFSHQIKEIVLKAFTQSQKDFDEDEILLPLQNVLAKISIPHITIDFTPYIDEIETRFKNGYAKNEELHQLTKSQSVLLHKIEIELATQLTNALQEITRTLKTQAVCFADQIEKEFCNELEKLKGQVAERECYIEKYHKFAENIRTMKTKLHNQ